jgi:nucleoside-diphosphate-sugar epimerase
MVSGNGSGEQVIALTGVSGLLAQRLLPLLDANPAVDRIVGLDVRDPARLARKLEFQRVDVLSTDLAPYLRGVHTVVHLALSLDPMLDDEELSKRVHVEGTRRLLDAAAAANVTKFVVPSTTAVYGAWANNPVPLTEDAPLRPSPGFFGASVMAECERLVAEWERAQAGRVGTRLRLAPVIGAGHDTLFAAAALGHAPVRVRGANAPVQVVHIDDAATALELATVNDLEGAYNAACDGWLDADEAAALWPNRRAPGIPYEMAERYLKTTFNTGVGETPPEALPYFVHPWVTANDRLKAAGWKPNHSNDEAVLLSTPSSEQSLLPLIAGGAAVAAGAMAAAWWMTRRARRRRALAS